MRQIFGGFLAGMVVCLLIVGAAFVDADRTARAYQATGVIGSPVPLGSPGEEVFCPPSATPNDMPTEIPTSVFTDIPGASITPPPEGGGGGTATPTRRR